MATWIEPSHEDRPAASAGAAQSGRCGSDGEDSEAGAVPSSTGGSSWCSPGRAPEFRSCVARFCSRRASAFRTRFCKTSSLDAASRARARLSDRRGRRVRHARTRCPRPGRDRDPRTAERRIHALRIHLVTVAQDGWIERHRIIGGTSGPSAAIRRRSRPSSCARSAISSATPVISDQTSVPLDTSQFRITVQGSPEWSLECYATEVHRGPVAFLLEALAIARRV